MSGLCPQHGSYAPCPWCAKGAPDFRDPPDLAAGPATVREPAEAASAVAEPTPSNTPVTPLVPARPMSEQEAEALVRELEAESVRYALNKGREAREALDECRELRARIIAAMAGLPPLDPKGPGERSEPEQSLQKSARAGKEGGKA